MFFIISGDCSVSVKDESREEILVKSQFQLDKEKFGLGGQDDAIGYKLLVEGDHFGEIGLIYGC